MSGRLDRSHGHGHGHDRDRCHDHDHDRGSASVLMLSIVVALAACAVVVAVLAGSSAARTRAQTAADLAALGAATAAMYGSGTPCDTARETAWRNGGTEVFCEDEGSGVYTVTVRVPAPIARTAVGAARAGPASAAR